MNKWASLGILVFAILILSIIQYFTDEIVSFFNKTEGFTINDKVIQTDNTEMIDSTLYYRTNNNNKTNLPKDGELSILPDEGFPIPNGYYKVMENDQYYMAKVPNNHKANDTKTEIEFVKPNENEPKVIINNNHVGQEYYIKKIDGHDAITKVPNGYISNASRRGIIQMYNADKYNEKYKNEDDINKDWIYDKTILGYKNNIQTNQIIDESNTYYEAGSLKLASDYVPNYEDSIYLSKSTQLSTVTPLYKTSEMMGGFCNQFKTSPDKLEESCNSISSNVCASTTCCVLLGGNKCVSGSKFGPTFRANFTDKTIKNKDFYYYLGKCYGNCNKPINNIPVNVIVNENENEEQQYTINANIITGNNVHGNALPSTNNLRYNGNTLPQ
jgi:hypothetical protein